MTKQQSTFNLVKSNCLNWSQECVGTYISLGNGASKLPLILILISMKVISIFTYLSKTISIKGIKNLKWIKNSNVWMTWKGLSNRNKSNNNHLENLPIISINQKVLTHCNHSLLITLANRAIPLLGSTTGALQDFLEVLPHGITWKVV